MGVETGSSVADARLDDRLVRPDDPGYDETRRVWNAMIDRRPALIARCRSVEDVVAAIGMARRDGLAVSIRGGGHHVAGSAVGEGALMIDLAGMNRVEVDSGRRVARVQGGALLGELDAATQAHALATPAGVVSTTGIGGLTVGGGFGWLSRLHGLTIDNLIAIEIVTADGRVLTANAREHADLFWAVRGGGGNFGVVTAFTLALHALGPQVLFGPTFYRLEDAPDVLRHYREHAPTAPRACNVWADLLTAPPLPFLPERAHGTRVLSLMQFYAGDADAGREVLAGVRGPVTPIGDALAPRPYTAAQSMLDGIYEKGARNYWRSYNFATLPDATLDGLIDLARSLPTPQSDILVSLLGGAVRDVAADATAFPHREVSFIVSPGARWSDRTHDATCLAWVREDCERLRAHARGGAYVNFVTETAGRERDAYGHNLERLASIKARHDPGNLFRVNHNIAPAS